MTTPLERTRAVMTTAELLFDLLDDPRIPTNIKERARYLLRHYPTRAELEMSSEAKPDIWGNPRLALFSEGN